jgi:ABC-type dipeptide/oligopeptide/nickel transport system permease component
MTRFILKRLLEIVPVLFIIVTLVFFMIRLAPGGPFDTEKSVPPEVRENIEAYYHLDLPLHRQYIMYLGPRSKTRTFPSTNSSPWVSRYRSNSASTRSRSPLRSASPRASARR